MEAALADQEEEGEEEEEEATAAAAVGPLPNGPSGAPLAIASEEKDIWSPCPCIRRMCAQVWLPEGLPRDEEEDEELRKEEGEGGRHRGGMRREDSLKRTIAVPNNSYN